MLEKRPVVLNGTTVEVKVGCGKLYITMNYKEDSRYKTPPLNEVFINPSFHYGDDEEITSYCCKSFLFPLGRLLTWQIRRLREEDRGSFLKQLVIMENAGCPRRNAGTNKSCIDAIGRVLMCYWHGHKYKDGICYICRSREEKNDQCQDGAS